MRSRGRHRIYVSHGDAILARLALPDPGRELATEFMRRQQLVLAEQIAMRPLERFGASARHVWNNVSAHWHDFRETLRERLSA